MSTAPTYKPLEIEVTDFGPIAKAKLDLRPLTVFVGPSNTGKSYLATLIYALHRFFGGYTNSLGFSARISSSLFDRLVESWGSEQEISEEDSAALLAWTNQLLECTQGKSYLEDFRARVPDDVAPLLRPLLREVSTLGDFLNNELARCFGSEGTARLVRHGSRDGSRVVLKRQVFEECLSLGSCAYEFTIKGNGTELSASIPDTTPMHLERGDNDQWFRLNSRLNTVREYGSHVSQSSQYERRHSSQIADPQQNELVSMYVEDMRQRARMFGQSLRNELVGVVGSSIVSPLNRLAHYLPADRAGVMDTHRVVLASLIERSSRAGFQRDEPSLMLSGVLTDFLQQLVTFGDLPQRVRKDDWILDTALEKNVLGGAVRENRSATGYPIFSYQPAGRKEDVPLMQASSMVSELAPVVLYLRHLVQPGDVLIIEEPESHLHPAMQAAFTRQLAAVVRAGVRVMLTTHSDYVLEELANLVRMSELPEEERSDLGGSDVALDPDEVGVWLFEQKKRPKGTVVKEIKLDKDAGTFPAGYGDVTEGLYNRWVEIDSRIGESAARQ